MRLVVRYNNVFVSLDSWPNLIVHSVGAGSVVRMAFGGTTTAFGVDYGVGWMMPLGATYTFSLWSGGSSVYTATRVGQAPVRPSDFFGVTPSVPLDAVTVATSQPDMLLDNVTVGSVATTAPERATWVLLGTGLGLVAFVARRRRAHA